MVAPCKYITLAGLIAINLVLIVSTLVINTYYHVAFKSHSCNITNAADSSCDDFDTGVRLGIGLIIVTLITFMASFCIWESTLRGTKWCAPDHYELLDEGGPDYDEERAVSPPMSINNVQHSVRRPN